MKPDQNDLSGYNRRDFLKGGSVATLMSMLGGVELIAETKDANSIPDKPSSTIKVGVIGLGAWGRKIVERLDKVPAAELAAICDAYEGAMTRAAKDIKSKDVVKNKDYQVLLANPDVKAVFIATPTHLHKEIAIAALKAGKHVYCEAPLAHTIEDARTIALAAKASPRSVFQPGLQWRADDGRYYALGWLRSGAIAQPIMARAQWHKKTSWRAAASTPEREKALNWRLETDLSLGIVGEAGIHQLDQANWFLNAFPSAVTGFGGVVFYKDGRQVPDTIQAVFEYPKDVRFTYDATLANSFDASYEVFCGSDAAVLVRDNREWLFQEVDSHLLGWEIYAKKEKFYDASGIVLAAGASKSAVKIQAGENEVKPEDAVLTSALRVFVKNAISVEKDLAGSREVNATPKEMDDAGLNALRDPAAGYLEGFQATVTAIKANEAIVGAKRIELRSDLYELS
jgi:predicted dehydrogenase